MNTMMRRDHTARTEPHRSGERDPRRAASRRTALVLASIAAAFFIGVIAAQYSGAPGVGISVLGFAIVGFLVVSIGRNVRR